jgi:SAM-dependent methyltransferase
VSSPATECAWCGAPLGADATRLRGRAVCAVCGAATTDPWPSDEEIAAAYGTWYRPEGGSRFSFAGDAVLARTRGLLASRIDAIAPPGPVLDVGAGDGTLLDALRARGRDATGLEMNSERPDFRDEPIDAIEGDGEWAAVILWHALEHLPTPGRAIAEAARLLRPGGVIAVAVPNNGSLQAQAFGDEWLHLDIPRHLVHLSTASLTAGLERNGLEPTRISNFRGGQIAVGWLDGLVGLLPGGLDLYAALRRPEARSERLGTLQRLASVAAGVVLLPVAAACAAVEVAMRRGGTVYVEARRA